MSIAVLKKQLFHLSSSIEDSLPLESYQAARIAQNLRLDLPCQRGASSMQFSDGKGYPRGFPPERGPNVTHGREKEFGDRLSVFMPQLETVSRSFDSPNVVERKQSRIDFFSILEEAWSHKEIVGIEDSCNATNRCAADDLPPQFRRYMDLRGFLVHVLFDQLDETRLLNNDQRFQIIKNLKHERKVPGATWNMIVAGWHRIREEIRAGKRRFEIAPRAGRKDVTFFGQGALQVEATSLHRPRSRGRLHHVIRELGLPGWETPQKRLNRLGYVGLTLRNMGLCAWRPTVVDLFGSFAYFFLPGSSTVNYGHTWCLTKNLDRNSVADHRGQPEWVMPFPKGGIPCQHFGPNGNMEPTFEIVGLSFSQKHADLFAE